MQEFYYLTQGFIIGLLASMPVGAIAIMSVQRTMTGGLWAGFTIGMGAALGDFIYAFIAGFGIAFIRDFLLENKFWLAIGGGIFLIIIGYKIYTSDTVKQIRAQKRISKRNYANDFVTSFLLAISNPVTIVGFTGFFASFGVITDTTTNFNIAGLLFGVFLGATSWWLGISFAVDKLKHKISLRNLVMINRVAGILVVVFGILLIISMFVFKKNV